MLLAALSSFPENDNRNICSKIGFSKLILNFITKSSETVYS
jgi:hypothetical protein